MAVKARQDFFGGHGNARRNIDMPEQAILPAAFCRKDP
jgi:hypothetical protein